MQTWAKHLFLKLEQKSATLWTESETVDILCCKGLEMSRALVVENPLLALSTFVKRKCRDSYSAELPEAFVTVGFGRYLTCTSSFFFVVGEPGGCNRAFAWERNWNKGPLLFYRYFTLCELGAVCLHVCSTIV